MRTATEQNELLFIIAPTRPIAEYVSFLKQHVRSVIGHGFEGESARAQISLFSFRDEHAEDLLYRVDSKVSAFTPFHIHVKNLNYFDHGTTRTIYLEVVQKYPIYELVETALNHNEEFTPCIPIARDLEINDFMKAWKSLKNLSYSDYFLCDHITVLKKSRGPARRNQEARKWVHYIDLTLAA